MDVWGLSLVGIANVVFVFNRVVYDKDCCPSDMWIGLSKIIVKKIVLWLLRTWMLMQAHFLEQKVLTTIHCMQSWNLYISWYIACLFKLTHIIFPLFAENSLLIYKHLFDLIDVKLWPLMFLFFKRRNRGRQWNDGCWSTWCKNGKV